MTISNYRVYITKFGDGAIAFIKDNKRYTVYIRRNDKVLKDIFDRYYNQLPSFKNRHYAIAKWIVTEIRAKGYVFKSYSNNNLNLRAIKSNKVLKVNFRDLFEEQIMYHLHQQEMYEKDTEFERLIH